MTFQQLRYIVEISKCNSMNRAAQNLYLSQTALSSAVKAMEKELGRELIVRNNRGIDFTPAGKELVNYAASLLEQHDAMLERFKVSEDRPAPVRLSVSSQRFLFLQDALVEYTNSHKDCDFSMTYREDNMGRIIEEVRDYRADIGMISMYEENSRLVNKILDAKELEFVDLIKTQPCVFMSKDNPLAKLERITAEDLEQYPYIYYPLETGEPIEMSEEYRMIPHFNPQKKICSNSCSAVITLMSHTNAYTIGSGLLMQSLGLSDKMITIPLSGEECIRIGCVVRKNETLSDEAESFVSLAKKYAGQSLESFKKSLGTQK